MGLILILMWLAALGVLGLPSLVGGMLVGARAQRGTPFWLTGILTAVVSVVGQYVVVLAPFVRQGAYSWDILLSAIFGWHLLIPALLAGMVWFVGRTVSQPVHAGVAAGLLLSIPVGIAAALPMLFTVPSLLGLRFEP